jgi:hypothetical protein
MATVMMQTLMGGTWEELTGHLLMGLTGTHGLDITTGEGPLFYQNNLHALRCDTGCSFSI